ncbi:MULTISPECIES: NAD-dependent epimerase/dehydratase family protein [Streptomyces]|uniref:NAD-dependent epimerase/dehydratase family protein n=2 Tax=Streptomyces rimosus subsp. rimosus TaxID=132474 RepID=A0A8A1UQB6_STRR1|nr:MULTISPECIES: NAD-dependent epimerase/dehydratase family protein [Streptomyces]KOG69849.1 reductase [Kitasatospora aureofaciens]MYT44083.1 NAD-dependent epimerase/dehydratase family protein [Streptomyces sp. SID5471]KEF06149.1 reductase [Streptomyces rimosus]KOT30200.1 reductase [Streptomyces rimosus subsp. rimosus]KOT30360.1 reductase [Streptomyces sp. NRRL WC-3701]
MKLLMLGGTEFVGRAVTEAALARGWQVTVFHRGRHAPVPGTAVVHGDRTDAATLTALADGTWDVVVDTWAGAPTAVRDAARLLADRAGRYVYVSTGSVYRHPAGPGHTEAGPLVDGSPDAEAVAYAEDKRGGELAALAAFGEDRTVLARAGMILGPWENIGRLPWWLTRIARGGPVLAPGPRDLGLQYIDVRDLAAWVLHAAETGLSGPYNLISEPGHATMGELLEACVAVTGSDAELRWSGPEEILAAGLAPWTELPVWLPPGELYDAIHRGNPAKALGAGLRCRPVAETVADTWAWLQELDGPPPLRPGQPVGLAPEKEEAFLRGEIPRG